MYEAQFDAYSSINLLPALLLCSAQQLQLGMAPEIFRLSSAPLPQLHADSSAGNSWGSELDEVGTEYSESDTEREYICYLIDYTFLCPLLCISPVFLLCLPSPLLSFPPMSFHSFFFHELALHGIVTTACHACRQRAQQHEQQQTVTHPQPSPSPTLSVASDSLDDAALLAQLSLEHCYATTTCQQCQAQKGDFHYREEVANSALCPPAISESSLDAAFVDDDDLGRDYRAGRAGKQTQHGQQQQNYNEQVEQLRLLLQSEVGRDKLRSQYHLSSRRRPVLSNRKPFLATPSPNALFGLTRHTAHSALVDDEAGKKHAQAMDVHEQQYQDRRNDIASKYPIRTFEFIRQYFTILAFNKCDSLGNLESLQHFTRLEQLTLHHSNIITLNYLPAHLKLLDVSFNNQLENIQALPTSLMAIKAIGCKLAYWPFSFQLPHLISLHLDHNNICSFSQFALEESSCPALQTLSVKYNPICALQYYRAYLGQTVRSFCPSFQSLDDIQLDNDRQLAEAEAVELQRKQKDKEKAEKDASKNKSGGRSSRLKKSSEPVVEANVEPAIPSALIETVPEKLDRFVADAPISLAICVDKIQGVIDVSSSVL